MPLVVVDANAAAPGGGWLTASDLAACQPSGIDADLAANATAELLFALSGYQYGTVTEKVRPFRAANTCACVSGIGGNAYSFPWTSHSAWSRAASCACGGPSYLRLLAPVIDVVAVTVDGETLEPDDDFTLYDGQWLIRGNGAGWPCCQDLTLPSTEAGTWAVTYEHGIAVPAAGKVAAQALGCEIAKAMGGDTDCAFSGRVQTVSRDGVSAQVVILDADSMLNAGRTGIQIVDLWLSTLGNLHGGTITRGGLSGLLRPTSS